MLGEDNEETDWAKYHITGTSQEVTKRYLRLTAVSELKYILVTVTSFIMYENVYKEFNNHLSMVVCNYLLVGILADNMIG